jgi:DNA repair protein RecO (recombination protein O)
MGRVPLYRDEAIVLRTHKLGEADRIITLLTRQHGRVRAVAKGVRRTSSRWGSRLEPFTHVDLQLAEGRSLDVITQAETLTPFWGGIGDDYDRYTAGTVMLETADRLVSEEREPSPQQFLLLVGGLRAMAGGRSAPSQVLDSYLLRSLAVAGWAPSFEHCVRCGEEGPHRWFNPAAGGVLCAACRVPGSARSRSSVRCSRATGRWWRPPTRATSRRRAAWWRRTSPGTSNVASGHWPTSSADLTPPNARTSPRDDP